MKKTIVEQLNEIRESVELSLGDLGKFMEGVNVLEEIARERSDVENKQKALDEAIEKLRYLHDLDESIKKERALINKEKEALRDHKLKLEAQERELKVKQDRISKILND